MTIYPVDQIGMLGLAIAVLYLGVFLTDRFQFLARNFIPAAVTGGLIVACLIWLLRDGFGISLEFDMRLRDVLLLVFFSTVGLSVNFGTLKSGGKTLPLLVLAAGVFLFLQNFMGVTIAMLLGSDPAYGLIAGSISFAGGHGTAIAWGAELEAAGLPNAVSLGMAFATFGLVAGGLVGGPIARFLITRFTVSQTVADTNFPVAIERASDQVAAAPRRGHQWLFDVVGTLLLLSLCISVGELVNHLVSGYSIKLPGFLTAMFVGIVLGNVTSALQRPAARETVDRFGTVSLHIFLAMSMMTVELWTLGGALEAIALVLIAQVLLMTIFAMLVVFFITGRDYDAVVIAAGFSGMGLGATPVAIANMNAVTTAYGPSAKALLLIPLIGAFFIDMLNAGTIQLFLELLP